VFNRFDVYSKKNVTEFEAVYSLEDYNTVDGRIKLLSDKYESHWLEFASLIFGASLTEDGQWAIEQLNISID